MNRGYPFFCWALWATLAPVMIHANPSPVKKAIGKPWMIDRMTCEYRQDPLGMDESHPRLGWTFTAFSRNEYQSACHILVASSAGLLERNIGDVWDSGLLSSPDNINTAFAGKPLLPCTRYFWKVKAYDQDGRASAWSRMGWFETGLMNPANWMGNWIGAGKDAPLRDEDFYDERPAPIFKTSFSSSKTVRSARLYISGLGYYEAFLNGKKIGDQVLDPGWTNYAKTVLYSVYDITGFLQSKQNRIEIMVGNGWYNPLPLRLFGRFNLRQTLTIGEPKLIANIRIQYTDGTSRIIATDSSWKTKNSPILKNNVYLGETTDGRPDRDTHELPAVIVPAPGGVLVAQTAPPIRITHVFHTHRLSEPAKGVFVFDLGQNFAGWIRIRLHENAGQKIHFLYGELLDSTGRVDGMTTVAGHIKAIWHLEGGPGAPLTAYQEDNYICSGRPGEIFQPHFTFHAFRYVEVTGLSARPDPGCLEGLRLNADLPVAGHFTCSDTLLNRIQDLCLATFLSNVFSVQSDCPGREKQGYGADMVVSADAFAYNFDMSRFYAKAIRDFANDARPNGGMPECAPYNGIAEEGFEEGAGPVGWELAFPYLQEQLFRFYGDRRILEEEYPNDKKLVAFLQSRSKDQLLYHDIGDHVALNPKHVPLTSGAVYEHHVRLLADFAHILGIPGDENHFQTLADSIKKSFNRHYLQADTGAYDTAQDETAQVFALWHGLAPEDEKQKAIDLLLADIQMNKGHLSTGIFGTKMLFDVLRRTGHDETALEIITKTDFPGYGYMLRQGATTLWETWERPVQNSWNHPMLGSVSEWLYRSLGGINAASEACGMDKLIIKPFTKNSLHFVSCSYLSIRGRIVSNWKRTDTALLLRIVIPPNTRAKIYIPAIDIHHIRESGKPVQNVEGLRFLGIADGCSLFDAVSGDYRFSITRADPLN